MTCTAATYSGVTAFDRRASAAADYRRTLCRTVGIGVGTMTSAGLMAGTAAVAAAWIVATALGGAPHLKAPLPLRAGTLIANLPPSFAPPAGLGDVAPSSLSPQAERDKQAKLGAAIHRVPFPRARFAALHADEGAREGAMLESLAASGAMNAPPLAGATPPSGYVAATFDLFDPQPTLAAALPVAPVGAPQRSPVRVAEQTNAAPSPSSARRPGSAHVAAPLQLADAETAASLPVAAAPPVQHSALTSFLHKLFGRQLASANPDAAPAVDSHTAIYDIEARMVYLPNGERLEAHSGLGPMMDDPRYVSRKDRGPTPPNVYDLVLREGSFHGVQAIRLKPVNDDKMFGRAGILAHPYMLGPSGQSFGCVSFKDYPEFLKAFERGEVDRLVVVPYRGDYPRYAAND